MGTIIIKSFRSSFLSVPHTTSLPLPGGGVTHIPTFLPGDPNHRRGLSNVKICDAVMGTLQYAWRTALELLEEAFFLGNERSVFNLSVC